MRVDNTQRSNQFNTQHNFEIGPGSYATSIEAKKIAKPSISRAPMFRTHKQVRMKKKNRGAIRADFEEGDTTSEEGEPPGPGQYMNEDHITTFGYNNFVHDHPE